MQVWASQKITGRVSTRQIAELTRQTAILSQPRQPKYVPMCGQSRPDRQFNLSICPLSKGNANLSNCGLLQWAKYAQHKPNTNKTGQIRTKLAQNEQSRSNTNKAGIQTRYEQSTAHYEQGMFNINKAGIWKQAKYELCMWDTSWSHKCKLNDKHADWASECKLRQPM